MACGRLSIVILPNFQNISPNLFKSLCFARFLYGSLFSFHFFDFCRDLLVLCGFTGDRTVILCKKRFVCMLYTYYSIFDLFGQAFFGKTRLFILKKMLFCGRICLEPGYAPLLTRGLTK